MNDKLQIVAADAEPAMRDYYVETLQSLGHQVVACVSSGRQLVEQCRNLRPDLLLTDIELEGSDGLEAVNVAFEFEPLPVIVVTALDDDQSIRRASGEQILAYLVKPIKRGDLAAAVALAMQRFEQFQTFRSDVTDVREALEHRRVIECAKVLLMKRSALDDSSAFARLQKLAKSQHRDVFDIATQILIAEEAVRGRASLAAGDL